MAKFCDLCKRWDPCDRPGCRIAVNGPVVSHIQPETMANVVHVMANETYRYRDPEKRRAYMKSYMAKRRSKFQKGLD
jgi:hypothetical protein